MGKLKTKKPKLHERVGVPYVKKNIVLDTDEVSDEETSNRWTKGKLIQRQKGEYRKLRTKIEVLKEKRMRLNKKTHKKEKKEITKEIKQLQEELEHKHQKEIQEYDQFEKIDEEIDSITLETEEKIEPEPKPFQFYVEIPKKKKKKSKKVKQIEDLPKLDL